jgi:hypothetical protein
VPALVTRVQDIAARMAAAGYEPRVTRHQDHIRVEAQVSGPVTWASWQALLAALVRADRFGSDGTAEGHAVWAAIDNDPAAGATARGIAHEPQGADPRE